jgi:hypothetical protein
MVCGAPLISDVRRQMRFRMSQKELARWERIRARGPYRYVALTGVMYWAGLTLLLWMAVMWFTVPEDYFARTFFYQPIKLILTVVIGGACFGVLMWAFNEFLYRRSTPGRNGKHDEN